MMNARFHLSKPIYCPNEWDRLSSRMLNRLVIRGNGALGLIVEKPFHSHIGRIVAAFDQMLPLEGDSKRRIFLNHKIRELILGLWYMLERMTVNDLAQFLDNLIYVKIDPMPCEAKNQIHELFNDSNGLLSSRHGLELHRYGYCSAESICRG